jgi:hypothetical protein
MKKHWKLSMDPSGTVRCSEELSLSECQRPGGKSLEGNTPISKTRRTAQSRTGDRKGAAYGQQYKYELEKDAAQNVLEPIKKAFEAVKNHWQSTHK